MKGLERFLISLLALAALGLILAQALAGIMGHDEDQFVATGLLTAERGLLPWRDYPLFHTPYYVILTGWLAHWFGHPFLTMRIFPGLCAWLMLVLLAWQSARWLRDFSPVQRNAFVLGLSILVLFSPIFSATILRAWNHQTPTLLILVAFCLHLRAAERKTARAWLFASGLCIGVAIGMRLSFVPLLAPFGLATLLMPEWPWRERIWGALSFSLGAAAALGPCLWLAAQAPEAAYFSNFRYPKLSLMWRRYPFWREDVGSFVDPVRGYFGHAANDFQGRGLLRKLELNIGKTFQPNWQLYAMWLLVGLLPPIWAVWRSRGKNFTALLLLLVLPFLLWGSLAPSRVNAQYWYAPLPILVLGIAFGIAQLRARAGWVLGALALAALSTAGLNRQDYAGALTAGTTQGAAWQTRALTQELKTVIGRGPVLTLKGAFTTMAGLEIYPAFASGEFGWRSAHLLPLEKRKLMKLICPYDLDAAMAAHPPTAIFLDKSDDELNDPFMAWGRRHGFVAHPYFGNCEIWLPAKSENP